jgi:hypothetical protein
MTSYPVVDQAQRGHRKPGGDAEHWEKIFELNRAARSPMPTVIALVGQVVKPW